MKECNIVKQSPLAGLAAYGGGSGSILFGRKGVGGYTIERSLRFNPGDNAYLNRTPSSSSNRRTFTYSYWIKECGKGSSPSNNPHVFWSGASVETRGGLVHRGTGSDANKLYIFNQESNSTNCQVFSNSLHRDFSAWKHIIWAIDTTQSTATNRVKLYVNGVQETLDFRTTPAQNLQLQININQTHHIGRGTPDDYGNFYLADIHFIDGSALGPSSFGETNDEGIWDPKEFTGSFGTNGFYLKFADNSSNAALGTDSSGNSNTWTVNNFSVNDGSAVTVSTATGATPIRNTTGDQGGTAASGFRTDANASNLFLALPLNTNTSDVSNSINSNSTTKSTTNQSTATSSSQSRFYGASSYWNANSDGILVAESGSELVVGTGDFTIELWFRDDSNHGGGGSGRCYLFDNRIGGSVVGDPPQLTGYVDGSNTIKFGCASTISVSKSTDNKWIHFAAVRSSGTCTLYIDGVSVGTASDTTNYPNNGFGIGRATDGGYGWAGYIQDFRVYKTAKYTSDFSIPADANPSVAAGNDSLFDSPTDGTQSATGAGGKVSGNYATLNPLDTIVSLTNGNLETNTSSGWQSTRATFGVSSGKWYWETQNKQTAAAILGISGASAPMTSGLIFGSDANPAWAWAGANRYFNGSSAGTGLSNHSATDIVMYALDADAGKLWFGRNGTWYDSSWGSTGNPATGANATVSGLSTTETWRPAASFFSGAAIFNFGARSFAYNAPSGFKALCTTNLPDPTIADGSAYFDTKLYTGNGSSVTVSNVDFSPDWVWLKGRSDPDRHGLFDTVRGATKRLQSSETTAEDTQNGVTAFNSDGFAIGNYGEVNGNGRTYAAWAWNAGANSNRTYTVKVVSDSGNKYRFDGHGTSAVTLDLAEGSTYVFDQSDSSNGGHPLRFSTTANGTHGGGTEYTTGVTVTGTPGQAGAKTTIVVASGAPTLYYYCTNHSGMGGQINTNSTAGATVLSGSSTSAAYDQSQTWSAQVSGTVYSATYAKTNIFDMQEAVGALPADNNELVFTPSPAFSNASTVKIWYYYPTTHANAFKINGTAVGNDVASTSGVLTHTFYVSGFTSLSWSRNKYGSEDTGISRIDVDGVRLADAINDYQTWSDDLTGTGVTNSTNGFDGDLDSYADSTGGWSLDLSGYTFGTGSHDIEVKSGGATSITVNGSTSLTDPGGGGAKIWTGSHTGEITSIASSSTGASVYYIKIDGKLLIDTGENYVTNVPSINSVMKASTEAGFSVFTYTGTGTAGTVGHGLNTAPEFYILKSRSDGEQWAVYHKSITALKKLVLNSSAAKADTNHFNDTEPTNSVLSIGSTGTVNVDGSTYLGYAFTSVEGFSAFGSYTGNGSSDGPFVFTGFRVAWLMIKNTSTSNEAWTIYDSTRDVDNTAKQRLLPNAQDAESVGSSARFKDLLSNGFKIRGTSGEQNTSGDVYIYAAFAEYPFKTARAR